MSNIYGSKNPYIIELSRLRDDDYNGIDNYRGYDFISTASHGYLVVTKSDIHYPIARKLCKYGYRGKLAVYLEEDCERFDFLHAIGR